MKATDSIQFGRAILSRIGRGGSHYYILCLLCHGYNVHYNA